MAKQKTFIVSGWIRIPFNQKVRARGERDAYKKLKDRICAKPHKISRRHFEKYPAIIDRL